MNMKDKGIALINEFEECQTKAYRDLGNVMWVAQLLLGAAPFVGLAVLLAVVAEIVNEVI